MHTRNRSWGSVPAVLIAAILTMTGCDAAGGPEFADRSNHTEAAQPRKLPRGR